MHTRGEEMEDPALVGSPTLTGGIPPSSAWLTADVLARQGAEVRSIARKGRGREGWRVVPSSVDFDAD